MTSGPSEIHYMILRWGVRIGCYCRACLSESACSWRCTWFRFISAAVLWDSVHAGPQPSSPARFHNHTDHGTRVFECKNVLGKEQAKIRKADLVFQAQLFCFLFIRCFPASVFHKHVTLLNTLLTPMRSFDTLVYLASAPCCN